MTIKDIEIKSGMSRANIRFYETEGLLNPKRRANGYREYSEDDLEILKRIKLLRTLHISLEEIKSLHTGERALTDTLNQHLLQLQGEKTDIEQAQEICEVMCNDGVQYQTLNAQYYLDTVEQSAMHPVLLHLSDIVPEIRIPWRRFFARFLDYAVYSTLWNVFLALVLNVNIGTRSRSVNILDIMVVLIIMFLLEPVMLSLFSTTPGKWILGICITDNEGAHMTYRNAYDRTRTMLLRGVGLGVPIYSQIRLWKSYKAINNGETLDWEYHSTITLKDERHWRIFAYLGIHAALIGVLALTLAMAEMPKNRGNITVAEFCENYNQFTKYYGFATDSYLDAQGNWVQNESSVNAIYIGGHDNPTFIFEETGGVMNGMQFTVNIQDSDTMLTAYREEMILSILAFVSAQEENNLFSNDVKKIVKSISRFPFESYQFSVYGVNITCNIVYSGYFDTATGILLPLEDARLSYFFSFSMYKEG